MTDTTAPRMFTALVIVTHADAERFGQNAWTVQSEAGDDGPFTTIETVYPGMGMAKARIVAASLHLARTHTGHRVSRIGSAGSGLEADLQAEMDDLDLRAFRAELRLIATSEQKGVHLTREQLTAWAGGPLTDDEVGALDEAIPNSSIPDAIYTIVNEAIR